jgi:molybdopterin-guanine dinucleotide biosynthesis protein A
MNISAVLLVGGESHRMGVDKAAVLFGGKPLWQKQLEVLRRLQPAEILVSARIDPVWRPADTKFVADIPPSRGPLSGLAAALEQMSGDHLLALAVDMPFMAETQLRLLCEQTGFGYGVVPKIGNRAEPLAAIYAAECRADAAAALAGSDFSLQTLIKNLVHAGRMTVFRVAEGDMLLYRSLNVPADLSDYAPL